MQGLRWLVISGLLLANISLWGGGVSSLSDILAVILFDMFSKPTATKMEENKNKTAQWESVCEWVSVCVQVCVFYTGKG